MGYAGSHRHLANTKAEKGMWSEHVEEKEAHTKSSVCPWPTVLLQLQVQRPRVTSEALTPRRTHSHRFPGQHRVM